MQQKNRKITDIEKKSSAITLSDMEIFVFPELLYSALLANIMSPALWEWKKDPWFKGIEKKSVSGRIKRLKQYIMDNYVFNLDLNTWGLTEKNRELERFKDFIAPSEIEKTNALFGYEGDKYYFDIDIRRHFGLQDYNDNIIPYWKTETIEAMDAFKKKKGFSSGAGECVSLSVLYAAAMFVVLGIPLSKIFLIATPLHSQNFVDAGSGFLTNNRRIITKNNWFNGTPISMKARRALENENISIIYSDTGYIHAYYRDCSIDKKEYGKFKKRLNSFLRAPLNKKILGSFLRGEEEVHKCIQYRHIINGKNSYIELEKIFRYEKNLPYFFTQNTRELLIDEIDSEEFHMSEIPGRIILNDLEDYVSVRTIDLEHEGELEKLSNLFEQDCISAYKLIQKLLDFCITRPKYPENKNFTGSKKNRICLTTGIGREEIVEQIKCYSKKNTAAFLSFYSFRDMRIIEPRVYLKAALERNPVSAEALARLNVEEIFLKIKKFGSESIYPSPYRIAQPDEVFNFKTGDGFEKAVTAANVILNNSLASKAVINIRKGSAELSVGPERVNFNTSKNINPPVWELSLPVEN